MGVPFPKGTLFSLFPRGHDEGVSSSLEPNLLRLWEVSPTWFVTCCRPLCSSSTKTKEPPVRLPRHVPTVCCPRAIHHPLILSTFRVPKVSSAPPLLLISTETSPPDKLNPKLLTSPQKTLLSPKSQYFFSCLHPFPYHPNRGVRGGLIHGSTWYRGEDSRWGVRPPYDGEHPLP